MWRKIKPYVEVMPALLLIVILFWGGIFYGIFQSFGLLPIVGKPGLTTGIYLEVLKSKWFLESLLFTLKIAGFSTFLSAVSASFFLFFALYVFIKKIM